MNIEKLISDKKTLQKNIEMGNLLNYIKKNIDLINQEYKKKIKNEELRMKNEELNMKKN